MKSYARLSLATFAFLLLPHFSSQDSKSGGKPNVNFYGTVTDLRETFKAQNITIDRLYKAIPAYQQPPLDATIAYDPADNITRLDLSEISKIMISPNQKKQKFGNREYIVMEVLSNGKDNTKNSYIIEADKRVFFDQVNSAGPIEKEIKLSSIVEISIEGYKQQEPDPAPVQKKPTTAAQATHAQPSKAKRLFSYVKNAFGVKVNL
jgi:hypothetical protein